MKHAITFKNQVNHWDNALPLGNGVFGCMVYYEKNKLHLPMNHYEVYYNIAEAVLPEDLMKAQQEITQPGAPRAARTQIAENNTPTPGEAFYYYRMDRSAAVENPGKDGPLLDFGSSYAIGQFSGSYPATGNITYSFDESLKAAESLLALYTEDAKVHLSLDKDGRRTTGRSACISPPNPVTAGS